jgi:hypothetical protein
MPHHDGRRIAGHPPRRFRGNARAGDILQHRLAPVRDTPVLGRGLGVCFQRVLVDVDHHLIAIARRPAIQVTRQGALGQEPERIRTALSGCDLRYDIVARIARALAKQPIARRFERPLHDGAELRRDPAANDQHPVFIDPRLEVPLLLAPRSLPRFVQPIGAPPGAHQPLDVRRGAALRRPSSRDSLSRVAIRVYFQPRVRLQVPRN